MKYLLVYVFIFIIIYLIEKNIIHIDIDYISYKIRNNMKYRLDNPKYTKFIDKLQFKDYCKSKGVDTVKTLKIYDQKDYSKINIKELPDKFILKSNKGSGRNYIVNSITRKSMLYDILNQCHIQELKLRRNISKWGEIHNLNEPQYEYTKPKIFAEELISPPPINIRLYYLNYRLIFIRLESKYINGYYDKNRNRLNIVEGKKYPYQGKTVIDDM
tara:strand:- start:94 stop:738 length:645 start_codon:yes stop_codon:yes gene_type:complete